jgi:hypothetical protein
MNRKMITSVLVVAILFASAFAGMIIYYNRAVSDKNLTPSPTPVPTPTYPPPNFFI